MSHELRIDDLSAYFDGELDKGRRAQVEAHLKGCRTCRETLSDFEHASAQLRETKGSFLAESFVFSVRAKIRSGSDLQVSWIPAERVGRRLVLALALVVIAVTGSLWSESEPVSGIVEGYYQSAQQDSALTRLLNADGVPTKDDLLLAVMEK